MVLFINIYEMLLASDSREIMMTSDTEHLLKSTRSTVPAIMQTAHQSPCPQDELQCTNGLCIVQSQLCDGVRNIRISFSTKFNNPNIDSCI